MGSPVSTQRGHQSWPARLARILLLLLLLLVATIAWLPVLLPYALQQQGILLHWQGARWSLHGLQLERLQLEYAGQRLQAEDLQLRWHWQLQQPVKALDIGRLGVQASLFSETGNEPGAELDLAALAPWLPQQLAIRSLSATLTGMANVSGSILLQADDKHPLWQPRQLELDLELTELDPRWLEGIPAELQPQSLRVRTLTHPDSAQAPDSQQILTLDLHSLGESQIQLSGILHLLQDSSWRGRLEQARLHLELPRYDFDGVVLEALQTQMYFNADASEDGFHLQLIQPASLTVAQLAVDRHTRLQQITATLTGLQLAGGLSGDHGLRLEAGYHASISQLHDPLLRPQTWNAAGTLAGLLPALEASAAISNTDGLQLDSNWHWQNDNLTGTLILPAIFLRAGNPLQKTLPDWPQLVEFNNGRLNGQASINLPAGSPLQVSGHFIGSGLDGIINRSELAGLDFTAFFRLDGNGQLRLDLPRLVIGELNPGVPIQQLTVRESSYSGHVDRLEQGTAAWQSIRGQVLGGEFALGANRIRLDTENRMQLQLSGVLLQDALALYPAEGLYGQATIDGSLPLLVSASGVFIEQGQLQARQPGILRFQSEQVRSLGRANPGMQLVAEALDDFHFNVLDSKLDYEPSGKLLFNIRLEGKNPAVENGRPIHLNLNLEEDLPALLASIQLSNHVSETIQERIRQRLQNR